MIWKQYTASKTPVLEALVIKRGDTVKFIVTLSEWVYKLEKVLAFIFTFIILFSLAAGVIFRYVFQNPLTWSDEVAMFSLAWLTFIGGSMTIRTKVAPTIDILTDKLGGKVKKVVISIGYLLVLAFVVYVFYISTQWISSPNILVQRSGSMGMPMIYAYLSIPVSFLFLLIHSLELTLKSIFTEEEV